MSAYCVAVFVSLNLCFGFVSAQWNYRNLIYIPASTNDIYAIQGRGSLNYVIGHNENNPGINVGYSEYISKRQVWSTQALLVPRDSTTSNSNFGVAIGLDGCICAVGSNNDGDRGFNAGSLYIYEGRWTTWSQQYKLYPRDIKAGNYFGSSLAIKDGVILVSSLSDDKGSQSGSVYIFKSLLDRQHRLWTQSQKLLAFDGAQFQKFGSAIALGENIAIIGAPGTDDGGSGSGSLYVYASKDESSPWSYVQKLYIQSTTGAGIGNSGTIALYDNTLAVANTIDNTVASLSGAVYIFTRSISNTRKFTMQQKLVNDASTGASGFMNFFGFGLSLYGRTLLVAAYGTNSNAGNAYIFTSSTGRTFSLQQSLVDPVYSGPNNYFGPNNILYGTTAFIADTNQNVYTYSSDGNWSCLIVSLSDQFGDGWDTARLLITAPDGSSDTYAPYCDSRNPFVFRYCPRLATDVGVYTLSIPQAPKAKFFWEIYWTVQVESTRTIYAGDHATRMNFYFDRKTLGFNLTSSAHLLHNTSCFSCPQKPTIKPLPLAKLPPVLKPPPVSIIPPVAKPEPIHHDPVVPPRLPSVNTDTAVKSNIIAHPIDPSKPISQPLPGSSASNVIYNNNNNNYNSYYTKPQVAGTNALGPRLGGRRLQQTPTGQPTSPPSGIPSSFPSGKPSSFPSGKPSGVPSGLPSGRPTSAPTRVAGSPTFSPSSAPTVIPSTLSPSRPTVTPTTASPSVPTPYPTYIPTQWPTLNDTWVGDWHWMTLSDATADGWFAADGTGTVYYVSDVDGQRLVARGTMCAGPASFQCWQPLKDGTYVIRIGGALDGSGGDHTWSFCGKSGGIQRQMIFEIRNNSCRVLSSYSKNQFCSTKETPVLKLVTHVLLIGLDKDTILTTEDHSVLSQAIAFVTPLFQSSSNIRVEDMTFSESYGGHVVTFTGFISTDSGFDSRDYYQMIEAKKYVWQSLSYAAENGRLASAIQGFDKIVLRNSESHLKQTISASIVNINIGGVEFKRNPASGSGTSLQLTSATSDSEENAGVPSHSFGYNLNSLIIYKSMGLLVGATLLLAIGIFIWKRRESLPFVRERFSTLVNSYSALEGADLESSSNSMVSSNCHSNRHLNSNHGADFDPDLVNRIVCMYSDIDEDVDISDASNVKLSKIVVASNIVSVGADSVHSDISAALTGESYETVPTSVSSDLTHNGNYSITNENIIDVVHADDGIDLSCSETESGLREVSVSDEVRILSPVLLHEFFVMGCFTNNFYLSYICFPSFLDRRHCCPCS